MTAHKYVKKETFNVLKSVESIPVVIRYSVLDSDLKWLIMLLDVAYH